MKVTLISHTQLSDEFYFKLSTETDGLLREAGATDGQILAMTAIRTCYSADKPSEIVNLEAKKYFGKDKDINRLINHIVKSGHTSTLEGITFNFAVEGVSRALLAQLTRHRVGFSYSVQSQRYVKFSSDSKSGGFDYVVPEKVKTKTTANLKYKKYMEIIQSMYNELIEEGIPQEDARSVLPQSATCNLVLTVNLRAALDFYKKRSGNGAQFEITKLAEAIKDKIVSVEPWVEAFFGGGAK
ncbi:FAD-dependent thymidylate synthase [Bacillus toyonensis]|uniref:FAD-dependent thymidylate synthase n=1 Tax=Bacillus toyonensis TaxID=155322 RepID=UPI000BFA352B|nr:FAD-dependent thymidylate synthase [Bacillus toyonensis]PGF00855.1 thymidylate synthase (FAD) [Bacillus toyonensis]PHE47011.1 thymidylate synthase (FAD) [Bacillus toyonensis]